MPTLARCAVYPAKSSPTSRRGSSHHSLPPASPNSGQAHKILTARFAAVSMSRHTKIGLTISANPLISRSPEHDD